jgi:hypothetical protein
MNVRGPANQQHAGQIVKKLVVTWSKTRAYAGDTVDINVVAENITDGQAVTVKVLPEKGKNPVETVQAGSLNGGKVSKAYKIDWNGKNFPPGVFAYQLQATADGIDSALSAPLWVDLALPTFSA